MWKFNFSVLSVCFGVKSIEPKCPNENWIKKKQPLNQATPCKYVCRFSLLSICFCFCFCLSLSSCVLFCCFSKSYCLSRVFFFVAFFFISHFGLPYRKLLFAYFFHLWSYKHFSVAVLRIFIAIRAEKPHIHYITFHYMMIRSHVYVLHYTCAVCDSSCYSFEHTTSMPSSNSMDSKNVHTGFAISIWGVFFSLFPRFPYSLCFALHFVNVGTNHTYILSTHNHVWCMYCTLYKHFLPILVWAGVGRVGGVGEGERKGAVVKHS